MQGGRTLVSPVVGPEPVQRCVQLDDVGAKEDVVSNLADMKASISPEWDSSG